MRLSIKPIPTIQSEQSQSHNSERWVEFSEVFLSVFGFVFTSGTGKNNARLKTALVSPDSNKNNTQRDQTLSM